MGSRSVLIAVGLMLAVIVGCRGGEAPEAQPPADAMAWVAGEPITGAQVAAYGEARGSAETPALAEEYVARRALMAAIDATGRLDTSRVEAELEVYRMALVERLYFETYLEEVVGETEVRDGYEARQEAYLVERADVSHILIRVDEEDAARTRLDGVRSRLDRGDAFDVVARDLSEDRVTAPDGGRLGWVSLRTHEPELVEAALRLRPGETSEPLRTRFGYHILRSHTGRVTETIPLENVRGVIESDLRAEARQAERARLLETVEIEHRAESTP